MVHIKRVELAHFKSFGGTTSIPFLPGFTVVSGPNGSGKSNILDALLFGLGLAGSKGMRADRLPDLINHRQSNNGKTAEASVSVTFDLSDAESLADAEAEESMANTAEWTVTRRLRVTRSGSYASNFYLNGEPTTVGEIHQQLERLRIYPEGYNVVLQGDVTRIITMNGRDRREIIDELAGVAAFDRKIEQTKKTLDSVRDREEKFRIIEAELSKNRDRLAADKIKAEKYQQLKRSLQQQQRAEVVLHWHSLQFEYQQIQSRSAAATKQIQDSSQQLQDLTDQIQENTARLNQLTAEVKALGEDEQLSIASALATDKAKRASLEQKQQELIELSRQQQVEIERNQSDIGQFQQILAGLAQDKHQFESVTIPQLHREIDRASASLTQLRSGADRIAAESEAWIRTQTELTGQITGLQRRLNPQLTAQAQLTERVEQLEVKTTEQRQLLERVSQELDTKQPELANLTAEMAATADQIQTLATQLAEAEADLNLLQETHTRLVTQQRTQQRQLDKLEATQQAQKEVIGTFSTEVVLNAGLDGVYGLVVELGRVERAYQLALSTAAGARLAYIVVEDDAVAARAIALLKQRRAGRATFLPLNKIRPPRQVDVSSLRFAPGFIDLAVNLSECEAQYRSIFAFVFGNTVVFESLDLARPYMGQYRLVTLEGDILESSGAMTGGSEFRRSSLRFGGVNGESETLIGLRQQLQETADTISHCDQNISEKRQFVKRLAEQLHQLRQQHSTQSLQQQQLKGEIARLEGQQQQLQSQLPQQQQQLEAAHQQLGELGQSIPDIQSQLDTAQQRLAELEAQHSSSQWQQIQAAIKTQELEIQAQTKALSSSQSQLQEIITTEQRYQSQIATAGGRIREYHQAEEDIKRQQQEIRGQIQQQQQRIEELETQLQQLNQTLAQTKQERDRTETVLRQQQQQQQQLHWQREKLQTEQLENQQKIEQLKAQIEAVKVELSEPIPEMEADSQTDFNKQLQQLQGQIRQTQKQLQALEPVNMLALSEYENNQTRLQELSEKLTTLAAERTELLLRAEKFTTLRLRAFKEAFDAVNNNFQTIFATLSDGDGYLQLENEEDPFTGGLNLVAHPKGKPVQRLSSMSGGEKSLTALSFIFALQRYRPSPFYAFDEVDMFLDGANVEKLSKMIQHQAQEAQFIVVSLRRPMIEAAQRTIGVTQSRGAHTQVLGIKL